MRMRQRGEVYRNWGDRALRGGGTQLDGGTGNRSQLGGPRGRRGLINGSCFGPNTQLGDLTKCFVSSPPLFFLARHNVCPHLAEGDAEQGGSRDRAQGQRGHFHALRLSIKRNEMRGCREGICFCTTAGLIIWVFWPWWYFTCRLNYWEMGLPGVQLVK